MPRLAAVAVFVLVLSAPPVLAAGPYDDLLKHVSANTNAVVLLNVKGAYASPLAKKEKWAERIQQGGYGGLGFIPPESELVAITAEVNFTSMVRDFQVGFVKMKNLPNFKDLAAREGGATEEIAGQLTVISPRSVHFTSFSGGTFAAAYPADRQYLARWLKADKAGKLPPLAPYLRKAADNASDDTVTIALDLEDVADSGALRFGLGVSPTMAKNKGVNQYALSVFLARVRGLTFAAKVTDRVTGSISIEFADEVSRYKAVLKDLFLEVIEGYGVSIAGLDQWEAKFVDKTITLSGSMSAGDLKRLVSLFAFPQPESQDAAPANPEDGPTAAATKRYMVAVGSILEDIKHVKDSSSYGKTATWHDNAAMQLEQLSRRNVDPLAVDFAYQAAKGLRAIAASLRGVPIDTSAAQSKAYAYTQKQGSYGWGPYGGGWWGGYRNMAFAPSELHTNLPEVQGEITKAIADDQKKRIATWNQLDNLLSDTKRKLGDKYKTNF